MIDDFSKYKFFYVNGSSFTEGGGLEEFKLKSTIDFFEFISAPAPAPTACSEDISLFRSILYLFFSKKDHSYQLSYHQNQSHICLICPL